MIAMRSKCESIISAAVRQSKQDVYFRFGFWSSKFEVQNIELNLIQMNWSVFEQLPNFELQVQRWLQTVMTHNFKLLTYKVLIRIS